jgi:hypothetical protein
MRPHSKLKVDGTCYIGGIPSDQYCVTIYMDYYVAVIKSRYVEYALLYDLIRYLNGYVVDEMAQMRR